MSLKLVRIDFRLIHGQVITKWIRSIKTNSILVVNDELVNDKFMFDIYSMAAPPGITVNVIGKDQFVKRWIETRFVDEDVMILIKNVPDVYYVFKKGVSFESIQIGGLGAGPGRKIAYGPITLSKEDMIQLNEISESGIRVYFHQVPEDKSEEYKKIVNKLKF